MKLTDKSNKPQSIRPNFNNIPAELKELKQFLLWKYVWRDGDSCWAKVPLMPNRKAASVKDPATWSSFEECRSVLEEDPHFDGLGYVFTSDDPYVGVDVDNCIKDSKLSDTVQKLKERLGSYAEYSPSRSGIHIICKGSIPRAGRGKWKDEDLEIYSTGRYFTLTGQPVGEVLPVVDKTMLLRRTIDEIQKEKSATAVEVTTDRRLKSALEKPYIKKLFDGDISEYPSQSEADMALCAKLVPYVGGSRELLDQMFRKSKLFRDKWDEQRGAETYGQSILSKVLSSDSPALTVNLPSGESTRESRRAGRFTVDSLWDRVMNFRQNGDARGYSPGWKELERYYRPTLGSLSVLLGEPSAGKSTFMDALAFNMCKNHNWRITMASFESLPIERHINNLCQIYLQKPTYTFLSGCASDKEMDEAREELNEWFNFISPTDDDLSLETMLKYVEDDIEEFGVNGFVLDPWTEVDIRTGKSSEVDSIKNELKRLQQFTRVRDIHTWLLVHPTKSNKDNYKQETRGMRPTLYSASGAAHFRNKALALDTKLPTPTGFTTMGDVVVGDTLFDERGIPCTVTNVTETVVDSKCYKITFTGGAEIIADAGHQWLTSTRQDRDSKSKAERYGYEQKFFPSVKTTEEIAQRVMITNGDNSICNHRVDVASPIILPEAHLPVKPYTLGAWLGDGRKYDGQFTSVDKEVINRIRQDGYVVNKHKDRNSWGIQDLKVGLRDLGVLGNKHIPLKYLRASYEQRLELLRGLMDTDGCASKGPYGRCIFVNTNKKIADGVVELLGTLGIKSSLVKTKASFNGKDYGPCYRVTFTTRLQVFNLLYKAKIQKQAAAKNGHYRSIVSVEEVPPVPVRCIEVSSPSHMFLATEHFIPTHNCDFGLVIHRWDDDTVSLYIDKVRNSESSGARGSVDFKFDTQRREYVEEEVDRW